MSKHIENALHLGCISVLFVLVERSETSTYGCHKTIQEGADFLDIHNRVVMRNLLLIGCLQIETDIAFMYEKRRHVNRKIKSEHAQNSTSQRRQVLRRNLSIFFSQIFFACGLCA